MTWQTHCMKPSASERITKSCKNPAYEKWSVKQRKCEIYSHFAKYRDRTTFPKQHREPENRLLMRFLDSRFAFCCQRWDIITYLRKSVKSVSQLFSYYPAASQPLKNDVWVSTQKMWSGSGQKPRQWRAKIRLSHTRFWIEWNAHDVRITRGNTSSYSNRRFCVEKRLTKPRVCGIIFPASERGSPRSNRKLRGIAQLVEQRSPNVNATTNICINTELSRLGTSVSSLFSCLRFW